MLRNKGKTSKMPERNFREEEPEQQQNSNLNINSNDNQNDKISRRQQPAQQIVTYDKKIQYDRKYTEKQVQSTQVADTNLLQHNIKKLLNQSAQRQQKYIEFIKYQKQQLFVATQKYAEAMSRYEKEIKQFIAKKQNEKKTKQYEKLHRMTAKNPPNLYKKKQYTIQSQCELSCQISFIYIVPLINDYLKQQFPQKFTIQLTQYYPTLQQKSYKVQLNPQIDEQQKLQMLKKGYSIQLYKQDLTIATYSFILSHFHDKIDGNKIIKYYKNNQLQFMFKDQLSDIILGYGKIDLQYFLLYNQESQFNQVQKIPVLSIDSPDKIIAFVHIGLKVFSIAKTIPQQHIHKLSQPITINKQLKFQTDKQSRLIQRINQYKNIHNSIIPSMTKQSNDKNILMHQKRKQLEQIGSYKQAHKNQFMDKVFQDAIEQFHTSYIQIGECKYIPFVYTNHTQRHQKAKIKISYRILTQPTKDKNQNKINITSTKKYNQSQSISVQLVEPATAVHLLQQNIINYPSKTQNCVVQYKLQHEYVFVLMGESILIFVKTICHASDIYKYQVSLQLAGDYGESIYSNLSILRITQPVPLHVFPFYSFPQQTNQIKIQVPSFTPTRPNSSRIGKTKIANIIGCEQCLQFESHWSENYNILDLKIKTLAKASINRKYRCFLFIYDIGYNIQLAAYQFNMQCLQKVQQKKLEIGRTQKFVLRLKLSPTEGLNQKTMIAIRSSDYLGSCCQMFSAHQKTKQFIIQPNVEHMVSINYNTFYQNPPSDKLIISCMDTISKKCLHKQILILNKIPAIYKHTYKLACQQQKTLTFDFQLYCNNKQQTTYKLYSSNYSLMNIQQNTIVMYANQVKKIKLFFKYWDSQTNIIFSHDCQHRVVVLAVDDGKNCTLYRFQLRNINAN